MDRKSFTGSFFGFLTGVLLLYAGMAVHARITDRNVDPNAGIFASKIDGGTFGSLTTSAYVFPGALTVTGAITASGGFGVLTSTQPRSASDITAVYSANTVPAGTLFLNTTNDGLCHSTSTVQSSIVISTEPATACP